MIGRLNHIAMAVPDLESAIACYQNMLEAHVSSPLLLQEHGVRIAFIDLPNTKIELMEPSGKESPIASFLAKNPSGGIHHVCYEVADIEQACSSLLKKGARILGDNKPKTGAHGKAVLFLHPKDFQGTLIELVEA